MNNSKKVILVVDDEQGMLDMLRWYLADFGFEIRVARDGQEALSVLSSDVIDLVVTDLTMPKVNGFKLLEALNAKTPQVSVIVVTGFGTVEMAVCAMRQGASDFLLKPFDPGHLVRRIREILNETAPHTGASMPAQGA